MIVINMGLTNEALYAGCEIEEVGGRLNLCTPMQQAVNIVGRNISRIVDSIPPEDRGNDCYG